MSYDDSLEYLSYPDGINPTYGLMGSGYMISAFRAIGLLAREKWVTFDEAYSICSQSTGVINPLGMYHFMAVRGVAGQDIYVANSAPGYKGVWSNLDRYSFNNLGPVKVIYVDS